MRSGGRLKIIVISMSHEKKYSPLGKYFFALTLALFFCKNKEMLHVLTLHKTMNKQRNGKKERAMEKAIKCFFFNIIYILILKRSKLSAIKKYVQIDKYESSSVSERKGRK